MIKCFSKMDNNQDRSLVRQPYQRPNMGKNFKSNNQKGYVGALPYCNQCNRYHHGHCNKICKRCQKLGHRVEVCKSPYPVESNKAPENCYNCGIFRHFVRDCPLGTQDTDQKQKGVITIKDEINHQDHKEYQWIDSRQVKAIETRIRELEKIIVSKSQASSSGTKRS